MQASASLDARSVFVAPAKMADVRDFADEEEAVKNVFGKLGAIVTCRAQYDPVVKRFGFTIEYSSIAAAQAAVALDGVNLKGRILAVYCKDGQAGQPVFASLDDPTASGAGAGAAKAAVRGAELLPHNEFMPDNLRVAPPVLLDALAALGDFVPLPPPIEEAPAAADSGKSTAAKENASDDNEDRSDDDDAPAAQRQQRIHELVDRLPGSAVAAELAQLQEEYVRLLGEVHDLHITYTEEREKEAIRARDVERIKLASSVQPGLVHSVWAPHQVRVCRTVVVPSCPATPAAIASVLLALARHGPIRTHGLLPDRGATAPGCTDLAAEYCFDESFELALTPPPPDQRPQVDPALLPEGAPQPEPTAVVFFGGGHWLPVVAGADFHMTTSLTSGRVPRGMEHVVLAANACLALEVDEKLLSHSVSE